MTKPWKMNKHWLAAMWLLLCYTPASFAQSVVAEPAYETQLLNVDYKNTQISDVTSGYLDAQFKPYRHADAMRSGPVYWLKFVARKDFHPDHMPVLSLHKSREMEARIFAPSNNGHSELQLATAISGFGATNKNIYVVPDGIKAGQTWYVQTQRQTTGFDVVGLQNDTMDAVLQRKDAHARMISMAFGALMALSMAVILMWLILKDYLLIHYAMLILMQALYVAYFTGQAFDWPVFSYAIPLDAYMWNIPIAISGTFACLFVRGITDMKHYSPRVHRVFGWLSIVFLVLAAANFVDILGLGQLIANVGNIIFLGTALFTLVMAFLAWRRGSRAAGFFLIAWTVLEVFTIATTVSLLIAGAGEFEFMLYYGLPTSMVAAAILMGLGVADRMREQRRALSDAERRAQTDPLTGVLNRRSFLERLDAACARAQARELPISLLFIDLDHFKQINDTFGHLAGDACLKAIIQPIHAELRQSDVIGRYGGEEFVVLLSSADAQAAQPIAERILKRIADVKVEGFGKPIKLTCSIGVATSDTLNEWGERLIAHADTAVYAAKLSGRNRVQLAQSLVAV